MNLLQFTVANGYVYENWFKRSLKKKNKTRWDSVVILFYFEIFNQFMNGNGEHNGFDNVISFLIHIPVEWFEILLSIF